MRIARIARPVAIYDASAAARTFSTGELIEFSEEGNLFSENEEKESFSEQQDFDRMPGFVYFKNKKQEENNANISKKN